MWQEEPALLIVTQIPLADARTFLDRDTGRLPVPTWDIPDPGRQFVRGVGVLTRRIAGGVDEFSSESFYCSASRAVRFGVPGSGFNLRSAGFRSAFRRFHYDGTSVARFEVGLTEPNQGASLQAGEDVDSLLRKVLSLPVSVPYGSEYRHATLGGCGNRLAAHYLKATTRRGLDTPQPEPWLAVAGAPLLYVEYDTTAPFQLPAYSQTLEFSPDPQLRLSYAYVSHNGQMVRAWFVGVPANLTPRLRDLAHKLRIHLSRLHNERESLKQILRLITQQRIVPKRGEEASQRLQHYLLRVIKLLEKKTKDKLPQSQLMEAARDLDETFTQEERELLRQALASIRLNLYRKLAAYAQPPAPAAVPSGVEIFVSYSHTDEPYRVELGKHLKVLQRLGLIRIWHDRQILPGNNWEQEIDTHLDSCRLILLLISADFMNSDYCYGIELKRALERSTGEDLSVVPVILRKCLWNVDPLSKFHLQALPKDARPIRSYDDPDEAYTEVATRIKELIESF